MRKFAHRDADLPVTDLRMTRPVLQAHPRMGTK